MMDFTLGTMYWLNPKRDAAGMAEDCRRIWDNGYRLVRIIAWWELVEKIEGRYDFSFLDRFFSVVGPYGLRVMFTIGFYPPTGSVANWILWVKTTPAAILRCSGRMSANLWRN